MSTLPAPSSKKEFVTAMDRVSVIIFPTPTGTRKSTQLPQLILENEFCLREPCRICCSCPRRLSARLLATQVGHERGQPLERGPQSVVFATKKKKQLPNSLDSILCATESTLLRIIGKTFFTHLLLDELQERNVEHDFLLARVFSLPTEATESQSSSYGCHDRHSFLQELFQRLFMSDK